MTRRRKSNRGSWNVDDMEEAIARIRSKELSFREAELKYQIPKSTLERRVNGKN